MTYQDLLDFRNQHIVEEVYKRAKNEENNEEIDLAYQEITERNQTKMQTVQYQYNQVMDKVSQVLGIIGMIIFAFLFIFFGALILAFFGMWIHFYILKSSGGWLLEWGINIYNFLFLSHTKMSVAQIIESDPIMVQMFYIIGLTFLFILIFVFLYVVSLLRKRKPKGNHDEKITSEKKLTLQESYSYLQANEDDTWEYIRSSFQRKLKRKNKDFYEHYYSAYICIFKNYQHVEGNFSSLQTSQKIKLCLHTFLNSSKNILGTFSKPIFFSGVVLFMVYRMFCADTTFTLTFFLSGSSIGEKLLGFMTACYHIVSATPFKHFLETMQSDLAKTFSVCFIFSAIYVIYSLAKYKIRECCRQFYRRMNFDLKKNQGIYDEKKTYSKCYQYSIEFTVFVVMVVLYCIYIYFK